MNSCITGALILLGLLSWLCFCLVVGAAIGGAKLRGKGDSE